MASCENICRLCTKSTTSTVYMSDKDSDKIKYIDKLKYIFNDVILEEDSKTNFQICPPCCKKLRQSYDFKKQCTNSVEYWQLFFHPIQIDIKEEPIETQSPIRKRGRPRKVTTENKQTPIKKEIEPRLKLQADIKIENIDPVPVLQTEKKSNLNIFSLKNKLNTLLSTETEESTPTNSALNPNIFTLKNKLNTLLKTENSESLPPLQLNLSNIKNKLTFALKTAVENEEKTLKARRKKRRTEKYYFVSKNVYIIDTKRKIFFCKLCNKYFLNWMSLKVHVVQDLGIKNFSCTVCRKRFLTHRELKLHKLKFSHQDE